jgi:hypothetical protein
MAVSLGIECALLTSFLFLLLLGSEYERPGIVGIDNTNSAAKTCMLLIIETNN